MLLDIYHASIEPKLLSHTCASLLFSTYSTIIVLGLSYLSLQFYKNLSTGLKDIVWKAEPIDEEKDG